MQPNPHSSRLKSKSAIKISRTASHRLSSLLSAASRMFTAGLSPSPPPRVITPRNTARTGTKPFSRSTQSSREQNPKKARWSCAFRSRDVAWVNSPKFEKLQRGIFFLKKDQVSGDPTASLGGYQVDVYTCLKPGDWLPLSEEARVRSLLKN